MLVPKSFDYKINGYFSRGYSFIEKDVCLPKKFKNGDINDSEERAIGFNHRLNYSEEEPFLQKAISPVYVVFRES